MKSNAISRLRLMVLQFLIENTYSETEENKNSLLYRLTGYYLVELNNNTKYTASWGGSPKKKSANPLPIEETFSIFEIPEKELFEQAYIEGIRQAAKQEKSIFDKVYLNRNDKKDGE